MTKGPIRISNSEIQVFKSCRRQWWLKYYRRLNKREEKMSGPLALGSRVHKALEIYYNDMSKPLLKYWSELIAEDRSILDSRMLDTDDFDNEAELGRIMLEGYLQWSDEEGVDSQLEIVSSEEIISAPFLDGQVELMAKIDQRIRRKVDGVRLFRDWKTTGNQSELERTAQMNEQFMTYLLLEMMKEDETQRCEGALITWLKKVKRTANAKPPFYGQIEIYHNIFTIRNFWKRLHGELSEMVAVRRALDSGADHHQVAYPTPTRDCNWKCEFFSICPMFDDGSAVEAAIDMIYDKGVNPYAYYEDPNIT